jgi:hypothetical protein
MIVLLALPSFSEFKRGHRLRARISHGHGRPTFLPALLVYRQVLAALSTLQHTRTSSHMALILGFQWTGSKWRA